MTKIKIDLYTCITISETQSRVVAYVRVCPVVGARKSKTVMVIAVDAGLVPVAVVQPRAAIFGLSVASPQIMSVPTLYTSTKSTGVTRRTAKLLSAAERPAAFTRDRQVVRCVRLHGLVREKWAAVGVREVRLAVKD